MGKKDISKMLILSIVLLSGCRNKIDFNGMNEEDFLNTIKNDNKYFTQEALEDMVVNEYSYIKYKDYYLFEYNNMSVVMKSKNEYKCMEKVENPTSSEEALVKYKEINVLESSIYDIVSCLGIPSGIFINYPYESLYYTVPELHENGLYWESIYKIELFFTYDSDGNYLCTYKRLVYYSNDDYSYYSEGNSAYYPSL